MLSSKNAGNGNKAKMLERRTINRVELTFLNSPAGSIKAQVFTLNGKCVRDIACIKNAGQSVIRWSGEDAVDKKVTSGIYLLVVRSAGNVVYKKPIVIGR
jgi:flagellar hook assembly protein FlgD